MIREFKTEGSWIFPSFSEDDEFCGTFGYAPTKGGILRIIGLKKQVTHGYSQIKEVRR